MPESHVLEPSQHPINKKEQERTQKQPAKRPRNLSLKSTKGQNGKRTTGPRWGRIYAPEGAGEVSGKSSFVSSLSPPERALEASNQWIEADSPLVPTYGTSGA